MQSRGCIALAAGVVWAVGCGGDKGGVEGNSRPIAALDAPARAAVGETIRLDASASRDPDAGDGGGVGGQIVSFRFVLSGGINDNALVTASNAITHVFTRSGMFEVCVEVTDGLGAVSDPACKRVVVTAEPRDGGPDARIVDAGPDARIIDARVVDATIDARIIDARVIDSGTDARVIDAAIDARVVDAAIDARVVDAAVDGRVVDAAIDARIIDAAPTDARPIDARMPDAGRVRYIKSVVPNGFRDIRNQGGTFDLGTFPDDNGRVIPLPGGFPYWDATFTQVGVASNGYLVFGGGPLNAFNNTSIPNPAPPNNAIFVFWDDLTPKTMGMRSQVHARIDFMGSLRMTIQWTNWAFFPPAGGSNMTFQVVLHQNGDIDFFHGSLSHPPNPRRATGNSATIGLENANGTEGVLHSFQMGAATDPGGVVNTMTGLHWMRVP